MAPALITIFHSQKLQEREAAFQKASFKDDGEKESWKCLLDMKYMSSEESGYDGEDETFITRPLPWLSATVQQFKRKLDLEIKNSRTPLARRQTKSRLQGQLSSRPKPDANGVPDWVFVEPEP